VSPIAIRSVEDRNGRVVLDTEREVRLRQQRMGANIQVISPQNAYVMTSMLKKTVEQGTLAGPSLNPADNWSYKFTFKDEKGKNFRMPMAGKTGTPQNWSDAWTVGFSPYYTTAIWFGFDKPGNSLGVNLTGSTLAGPVWADFMREIHQGLPQRDFIRPSSGVIDVTVCVKSGLLKTAACNQGDVTLPFLEGTQPSAYCNIHGNAAYTQEAFNYRGPSVLGLNEDDLLGSLKMPSLDLNLLPETRSEQPAVNAGAVSSRTGTASAGTANTRAAATNRAANNSRTVAPARPGNTRNTAANRNAPVESGNRLLDGDDINFDNDMPSPVSSSAGSFPVEIPAGAARGAPPAGNAAARVSPDLTAEPVSPVEPVPNGPPENSYGLELPDYNPLLD
jgi:penicillin-binding protein 1A